MNFASFIAVSERLCSIVIFNIAITKQIKHSHQRKQVELIFIIAVLVFPLGSDLSGLYSSGLYYFKTKHLSWSSKTAIKMEMLLTLAPYTGDVINYGSDEFSD